MGKLYVFLREGNAMLLGRISSRLDSNPEELTNLAVFVLGHQKEEETRDWLAKYKGSLGKQIYRSESHGKCNRNDEH